MFVVCGYSDLRYRCIPNLVLVSACVVGITLVAVNAGAKAAANAFLGGLTLSLPFFLLYRCGGVGGGDVKLAAAIGILLPCELGWKIVAWGAIGAAGQSLVQAVILRKFLDLVRSTTHLVLGSGGVVQGLTVPLGFWMSAVGVAMVVGTLVQCTGGTL